MTNCKTSFEPMVSKYLLPSGFRDILYPESQKQYQAIDKILQTFSSFGYEYVIPPMIEYVDSLLAEQGSAHEPHCFKITDNESPNKTLGLRADMTTQIMRIAKSKLSGEKLPLRLSYSGTVLRSTPSPISSDRQLIQVGLELIGTTDAPELEIAVAVLESLSAIGIKDNDVVVDISIAGLLESIINSDDNSTSEKETIIKCVNQKNIYLIDDSIGCKKLLTQLSNIPTDAAKALAELKNPNITKQLPIDFINNLETFIEYVEKAFPNVTLTVDILENKGFEYHSGLCFSMFLRSIDKEIGRGGCYNIPLTYTQDDDNKKAKKHPKAAGATLYINQLRDIVNVDNKCQRKHIGLNTPYEEGKRLRDSGVVTILSE